MRRIFSGSRYANVTATMALVIAMTGTSYAAATLAKNSVGSKQIKANAVTASKVKDGSLTAADFKSGAIPAGAKGATGAQGPKGDTGAAGAAGAAGAPGAAGRSALTPLAAGETIRGVVGMDLHSPTAGSDYRAAASYPIPLAATPTHVYIDGVTPGEDCTGTATEPTAPAGEVCIYTVQASNPGVGASSHGVLVQGTLGFRVTWAAPSTGDTYYFGTWAATGV